MNNSNPAEIKFLAPTDQYSVVPGGRYTATGQGDGTCGVAIERISADRRCCPADIMTQKDGYLASLRQVTSAAIQENMITLFSPMGNLVFYLIRAG